MFLIFVGLYDFFCGFLIFWAYTTTTLGALKNIIKHTEKENKNIKQIYKVHKKHKHKIKINIIYIKNKKVKERHRHKCLEVVNLEQVGFKDCQDESFCLSPRQKAILAECLGLIGDNKRLVGPGT